MLQAVVGTFAAVVVGAQDGGIPAPSGPHDIGTVTHHWVNLELDEPLTPNPNDARQLVVQLWYPSATTDSRRAVYFPEVRAVQAAMRTDRRDGARRAAGLFDGQEDLVASASCGASVADGRWPVVLLSPGGNMSRHWYTGLAEDLASHGFVVLAMGHAHSTLEVFPAGGFIASHDAWRALGDDDAQVARQADDRLSDRLAADARFALDKLTEIDADDPKGRFTGKLDLARVGIVGHSRGGKAVARACSTDDRISAAVVMDNIGPDRERATGLSVAHMLIRTDDQRRWDEASVEAARGYLARNASEGIEVVVAGAAHNSFTDLPFVAPRRYAGAIDARKGHEIVVTLTRSFLNEHLLEQASSIDAVGALWDEVAVRRLKD